MELKDYLRLLRQRWWLLLLCLGLGAAGAYTATDTAPQSYTSGLTFFLADADGRPVEVSSAQLATGRLGSYQTLAASGPVYAQAVERSGVAVFTAEATAVPGTIFLRLTVNAATPQDALAVAQAYEGIFPSYITDFENGGTAGADGPTLGVLEPPRDSAAVPGASLRRNVLLGLVLGFVVGAGILIVLESLDNKVRDVDELERMTDVGVAAAVPWEFRGEQLVTERHPRSKRAEAMRLIRTNVQFAGLGASLRTLVVTSAAAGEGKTSVASDLALAYAQAGQRVILVDGDLRQPRIAELFGIEAGDGATNVLVEDAHLDEVLHPWGDGQLRLLTSGTRPAKPSELLASAKMGELLARLRADSDLVIIDSAPVLPVADTAALLAHVDAVLLVVRGGVTSSPQVRAAVERLRSVDARIVGLVLNGARAAGSSPYSSDKAPRAFFRSRASHLQRLMDVPAGVVTPPSNRPDEAAVTRATDAPATSSAAVKPLSQRLRDVNATDENAPHRRALNEVDAPAKRTAAGPGSGE